MNIPHFLQRSWKSVGVKSKVLMIFTEKCSCKHSWGMFQGQTNPQRLSRALWCFSHNKRDTKRAGEHKQTTFYHLLHRMITWVVFAVCVSWSQWHNLSNSLRPNIRLKSPKGLRHWEEHLSIITFYPFSSGWFCFLKYPWAAAFLKYFSKPLYGCFHNGTIISFVYALSTKKGHWWHNRSKLLAFAFELEAGEDITGNDG